MLNNSLRPLALSLKAAQRGVSILMALTLVVIVTAIISGVALTTHYAIRRSAVLTHGEQASAYAEGGVVFAQQLLRIDGYTNDYDSSQDNWAQTLPAFPVEGGQVQGRINELSSRFNLAMLAVSDRFEEAVFKRLWQALDGNAQSAAQIIATVRSGQYASVIGVLTAAGIDEKAIQQRATYLTYLPINADKLNINFVSAPVFAAYFNMAVTRAEDVLSIRETAPVLTRGALQAFARQYDIDNVRTDSTKQSAPSVIELRFGVKSRYFQVVTTADVGEAHAAAVVMLDRNKNVIKRLNQRLSKLASE